MRTLILLCSLICATGCVAPSATGSDKDGAAAAGNVELSSSARAELLAQRDAFLAADGLTDRMQRLLELEQQALQLAVDEPLKLGSIGSAILDIYAGSQTGHYAMSRFYAHVESADAQAVHDGELTRLQAAMQATGDGSIDTPYEVLTIYDAHTFARSRDAEPVGSIYQNRDLQSFGFLLVSRPQDGPLQRQYFDISHVLRDFAAHASGGADDQAVMGASAWALMRMLASRMDTAAQAAIGRYLASAQKYEDAASWLQVAARSGNVLANELLARIYYTQAETTEDETQAQEYRERALENHLHAIAMGSTDSMYTLANLYINDYYGEENRAAAIPLLRQAGDLNHAESLLYLGHLHNIGREVPQDVDQANAYFARAASLNNPQAIVSYGRFLTALDPQTLNDAKDNSQIHTWLQELADDDNAEAMVVLGNLHARGLGTRVSTRRAVSWYKKAVAEAPEDADIVNEVAWTLTVSDVDGLKRARYAKRIMDNLMNEDASARARPEYLDTWAAAHAASGDFEQAIALQEQAIAQASSQQREDVLDILKDHLEQFKAGGTITEKAP